jgi:hypothetical protein
MGGRLLLDGWRDYWRRELLLFRHMVSDDSQSVNKETLTRAKRNQLPLRQRREDSRATRVCLVSPHTAAASTSLAAAYCYDVAPGAVKARCM